MAAIVPVKIARVAACLVCWCFSVGLFLRSTLKKLLRSSNKKSIMRAAVARSQDYSELKGALNSDSQSVCCQTLTDARRADGLHKVKVLRGTSFFLLRGTEVIVVAICWHFINVRRLLGLASQRRGNFFSLLPPPFPRLLSFVSDNDRVRSRISEQWEGFFFLYPLGLLRLKLKADVYFRVCKFPVHVFHATRI